MMGYAGDMMTAGVALSRQGELKHVRFQAPSSGVLMGRTRATRAVRDSVAKKIAKRCHTSSREARKHFLPYMNVIFRCDKNVANRIAEELELEDAEINYLAGV
jgi:replication factor C large subunit